MRGVRSTDGKRVIVGLEDWRSADFLLSRLELWGSSGWVDHVEGDHVIHRFETHDAGWLYDVEVRLRNSLADQRVRLLREVWIEHGRQRWTAEQAFAMARRKWRGHPALEDRTTRTKRDAWAAAKKSPSTPKPGGDV